MRQLKITKSITNRESASLDKYLQEIGREELVSPEEEVELSQRIQREGQGHMIGEGKQRNPPGPEDRKDPERGASQRDQGIPQAARPVRPGTGHGRKNSRNDRKQDCTDDEHFSLSSNKSAGGTRGNRSRMPPGICPSQEHPHPFVDHIRQVSRFRLRYIRTHTVP